MLRFAPEYKAAPWGGRKLATLFERTLPAGPIGEAWELVDLPEHTSKVRGGKRDGEKLGELWRAGVLGGSAKGNFPFLLKWLDPAANLSVQVHPDAPTVRSLGKGAPKTEAWYVAQADPSALIYLGHYPGLDAATLRQAAKGGTIHKWLHELYPRPGQFILVEAGTLHAIGPGALLLEVQQPSDTTYRVFDWNRPGLDGKPRALHLDEAVAATHFERAEPGRPNREGVVGPCFSMHPLKQGQRLTSEKLRVIVAGVESLVLVSAKSRENVAPGEVVVAESIDGELEVNGGQGIVLSEA